MTASTDFRECLSCYCFGVRRAARLVTQHYDRQLRPSGLRATQFTVLVMLTLEGPQPMTRLADGLGVQRTTLTRNLRLLVSKGLVATEPGRDRRVQMVAVTPRGVAAARRALPRWRRAQSAMEGHVTGKTLQLLQGAALAASRAPTRGARATAGREKEG